MTTAAIEIEPRTPGIRVPDILRFERRICPRNHVDGAVTATYSDGEQTGIVRLELLDTSLTGLGALVRRPLPSGARITLCPRGIPVPWRTATVVRCQPESDGFWSLGLRYDRRIAA